MSMEPPMPPLVGDDDDDNGSEVEVWEGDDTSPWRTSATIEPLHFGIEGLPKRSDNGGGGGPAAWPREDGTLDRGGQPPEPYGPAWAGAMFDREDLLQADPDYQFLSAVAGAANTSVETLYRLPAVRRVTAEANALAETALRASQTVRVAWTRYRGVSALVHVMERGRVGEALRLLRRAVPSLEMSSQQHRRPRNFQRIVKYLPQLDMEGHPIPAAPAADPAAAAQFEAAVREEARATMREHRSRAAARRARLASLAPSPGSALLPPMYVALATRIGEVPPGTPVAERALFFFAVAWVARQRAAATAGSTEGWQHALESAMAPLAAELQRPRDQPTLDLAPMAAGGSGIAEQALTDAINTTGFQELHQAAAVSSAAADPFGRPGVRAKIRQQAETRFVRQLAIVLEAAPIVYEWAARQPSTAPIAEAVRAIGETAQRQANIQDAVAEYAVSPSARKIRESLRALNARLVALNAEARSLRAQLDLAMAITGGGGGEGPGNGNGDGGDPAAAVAALMMTSPASSATVRPGWALQPLFTGRITLSAPAVAAINNAYGMTSRLLPGLVPPGSSEPVIHRALKHTPNLSQLYANLAGAHLQRATVSFPTGHVLKVTAESVNDNMSNAIEGMSRWVWGAGIPYDTGIVGSSGVSAVGARWGTPPSTAYGPTGFISDEHEPPRPRKRPRTAHPALPITARVGGTGSQPTLSIGASLRTRESAHGDGNNDDGDDTNDGESFAARMESMASWSHHSVRQAILGHLREYAFPHA